jgi:glycosyltransferase involved in cell wall biosynthesis
LYRNFKEIQADFVVPPGLDFTIFHPGADPAKSGRNGAFRVGCIGRPEPSKGTKHVLDAFEKLHEADDRYELRIAFGCTTEQSQPGIEVVVPRSDRELADFYRSLDVLIAPGTVQHGAAHYPVLEAMACGVPVVTTGYLPANEGNSWLVPNEDSDSIVTAVRDIAQGREVQERVAQALRDVGQFGWDRTAQDMLVILEQNTRR